MELFQSVVEGKKQSDGAFEVELYVSDRFCHHQVQVQVSAAPAAGSLAVAIRSPGATDYVSLDGTIDMTSADLLKTFGPSFVGAMRFTPQDFDADKTYDVIVTSGGGNG